MITDARLDALLVEDAPHGDLTTESLGIGSFPGRLVFTVREPLVLAGAEEAARLLGRAGAKPKLHASSGVALRRDELVLEASGTAAAVHLGWKAALHLLEHLSGIATRTRRIVDAARSGAGRDVPIAATRKGFPGTRDLALLGVRAGGGIAHRLGLSDSILVFQQHAAFLEEGVPGAIERMRRTQPERKIAVEVSSVDEAVAAARAGAHLVQVEKVGPREFAEVVRACRMHEAPPLVAATGGVDESNAEAYAAAGADLLVTSAPWFAKPAEIRATISRR